MYLGLGSLLMLGAIALGVVPASADDHATPPTVVGELITTSPDDANLKWAPCPDIFPAGCEVTVLSGDPANGPSDVYLRATPNTDLNSHWHHSPEHVVLVKGKFSVTFADGRKASLDQGAYTLIPAGLPHSARCEGPESCVIFIGFEKPVDAIAAKVAEAK
jgi:mannose-6-phosphate isomerase-like protein (cupin superfamily)